MTILAAIGKEAPDNDVISVAADLAETYDDELVVLHVIPDEDFEAHQAAIEGTPAYEHFTLNHEESSARDVARAAIDERLGEHDHEKIQARGRVGKPAKVILEEADVVDARFVVIGVKGRSPVGKALFGNTTQRVLLETTRPVVTTPIE